MTRAPTDTDITDVSRLPDGYWRLPEGNRVWIKDGKYHRTDGPALVCASNETLIYYQHGKYHRDDGPALVCASNEVLIYYQHGKHHRDDGPAYIDRRGQEWWLNNKCYTFSEWVEANDKMTGEQKVMLKLMYGDGTEPARGADLMFAN